MSGARRPFLVVIRHGPIWNLDGAAALAECLGRSYSGEIWTFAGTAEERVVGTFRIRRDGLGRRLGSLRKIMRIGRLVCRGVRLRWISGHDLVVIAYDPMASGIVGVLLKYLAAARFICEVNGVYGDRGVLMDPEDQAVTLVRRKGLLALGPWVLSKADHIKLLFPEQLEGYRPISQSVPRDVLFDFVDDRKFPFAEGGQEPLLLFVGYPFFLKGVDVLLEAFSRVVRAFPDWRLVLIGFRLEEHASKLGLPSGRVQFLGPQSQEAVSQWLERCSALVLPSRSEAMGRVLLEAALKGRARLGSRAGGIPHYISHGTDGLLFEPDSVDDLESTLRDFMSDPDAPARLGRAARARAEREYTSVHYLRAYERIISGLT